MNEARELELAQLQADIKESLQELWGFLKVCALSIFLAFVRVLPTLLKIGLVLAWASSVMAAFAGLWQVYARVFNLAAFFAACALVLPFVMFPQRGLGWGGYALAFVGATLICGAAQWLANYPLVLSSVPPLLSVARVILAVMKQGENQHGHSAEME